MKRLKGTDFMARISNWEETRILLLELKESLACAPEDPASTSKLSWQSTACDKILRACIHWLGLDRSCLAHFESLLDLAELACQGYIAAGPQHVPLYLEKILYHLLRNVATQGAYDACLRFAELLYANLARCRPPEVPAEDFEAIAKSSFSVLWKGADALAKSGQAPRVVLSGRLQAVRFLVFLEEDYSAQLPLEPPFFTSQVARQAAAAAVMFEAQRTPLSKEDARFFSEQLARHLIAALLDGRSAVEPLPLQWSLCLFELTLERCRRLCKSSCFGEGKEAIDQAQGYLEGAGDIRRDFAAALGLLRAGVQLNQVLALGESQAGLPLSQAAAALSCAAGVPEPLPRVLGESCQFIVSSLNGYMKKSKRRLFSLEDILGLSTFMEGYSWLLRRLLDSIPPDNMKPQQAVKQLHYHSLQLYTTVAYDAFLGSQVAGAAGLEQLVGSCQSVITWMLDALEGLSEQDQVEYLDVTASCAFKLAYGFYSQKLYVEASSVTEVFCQKLGMAESCKYPEMSTERLHKCFKLQVESYRKLCRFEKGLESVALWLAALHSKITEQMAEPVLLWVRVKMDATKNGDEDLRLKTLKEGLEGHGLDVGTLVSVLSEELKAYKATRADTGQERFNVICDLLEICSEESGREHERAVNLVELAQVLCYHDYTEQTACSSLDSVREALRLLDSVPVNAENQEQLLDDKAQAMLWLYICTLESKMQESIERDQRAGDQGHKNLEDFEPNDLNYEDQLQDDKFLYNGISFNLVADSAQAKCLDDALALWKKLLAKKGVPAVRSVEQTVVSLHIMAALYRMMAKPLQSMESYLLIRMLSSALGDWLGTASALCQVTKLLFLLESPSEAKIFLEEAESCLQKADCNSDSYLLLKQTCLILHSQLCCANHKVEEGLTLLLEVLQHPALQKISKVWYLLRAHVLQLMAVYLNLPSTSLSPKLRQQLWAQGWKTPETALADAHKLFRSILLLLMGGDLLSSPKTVTETQFVDHGENLLQKWQVLADMLVCSEKLIALFSQVEMVCEAKAFCLEALKLTMKLQAIRWCAGFLVLKAKLELQRSEPELCHSDLQQALFLLESGTDFETKEMQKSEVKIKPKKGRSKGSKRQGPSTEPAREEDGFLKGPSLEFVDTVSRQEKENVLTTSPVLKPKKKRCLNFLSHSALCSCSLCSDVTLSAVCLHWAVSYAQWELASGNRAEGLGLLQASLERCTVMTSRFSTMVQEASQHNGKKAAVRDRSMLGLLDDLVANIYATVAAQSMGGHRPEKRLWELLEAGLTFLSSRVPCLPGLEYHKASLLLTKAVATIYSLVSKHNGCMAHIFSSAWAWKPPTPSSETKGSAVTKAIKREENLPLKSKSKKIPVAASGPKPKAKRDQGVKPLPLIKSSDVFVLGDSDGEVPPIVIRPVMDPCTPVQKSFPPTKGRSHTKPTPGPKAPFMVFNESSPPGTKSQLLKAPKASKRIRSRLKVVFSDDSDVEDPTAAAQGPENKGLAAHKEPGPASHKTTRASAYGRKASRPKALVADAEGAQAGSSDNCPQSSKAKPRRTRAGNRKAAGQEKKEGAAQRGPSGQGQEEEGELLRTIKEEEVMEEGFEISFEVLRGSDEEEPAPGRKRLFAYGQDGVEGEHEVLRRDASADLEENFLVAERKGSHNPFNLQALSSSLAAAVRLCALTVPGVASLDSVSNSLKAAFQAISHCPTGTLYSQLCRLLALCIGSRDPITTAYLVSESVSITVRHQLMSNVHRRLYKMKKKSAADVADQLQELTLQGGDADLQCQHLLQLQSLFEFSSAGLGQWETESFREQLQKIPSGVTVCLLTLVSLQPGTLGDTLLLTRLEKDSTPVTIHIPTAQSKAPLSSVLGEFDAIQKEQKEYSSCTDKRDWWLGRTELDRRMKVLTETLEKEVLSCWKGALLPASQDSGVAKEASSLQEHLGECGWENSDLALLKLVLNSSHLLTPQDVQCLASGLCPAQPDAAQAFLREAVDKWRSRSGQTSGHLVLVLDKHLQKLPWENIPCLRTLPVTRLPSLRFLLSYNLAQRYRRGSILTCGVNPSSAFYVLNPHDNLPGTEERFRAWFESEPGWMGVTGEVPSQEQMQLALTQRDLYVYAGHGAGARFLDGPSILKLDCRAVALLFGCSSAALAVRGNLEGTGIILKYIMAGCPLVLGNLWDVTDRDIDRYMEALLQSWLKAGSGAPLLQHVAQSRQAPKLKYLIGAAPIAYGLPVSLQ
ncbi:separin isoform X1 [Malaclemys terrapin pileata]|uniref:separin isoform X1 n=1 Tax=Malaclemys terrapin pileata TaxID=2991368 RepID=UPI0023A855F8|nr:separin isoform X1 [Malaclemys terrapin pileata]XP_053868202.1 separin isoform X1 [Malaclemys terrapin pileata]XP_053868203.1 separin isoform X1 [Malaclemys terrapin pileata]